jgi:hypothetical protein
MIAGVRTRRHRDDDVPQIGEVHATSRHATYAGLVTPEALARVTPQTQARGVDASPKGPTRGTCSWSSTPTTAALPAL